MNVAWSRHARERFFERAVLYGINYAEVEMAVIKQKIRLKQAGKNTIKTIFQITNHFFTVIKEENRKLINVVSIWESNENEVQLCQKK